MLLGHVELHEHRGIEIPNLRPVAGGIRHCGGRSYAKDRSLWTFRTRNIWNRRNTYGLRAATAAAPVIAGEEPFSSGSRERSRKRFWNWGRSYGSCGTASA